MLKYALLAIFITFLSCGNNEEKKDNIAGNKEYFEKIAAIQNATTRSELMPAAIKQLDSLVPLVKANNLYRVEMYLYKMLQGYSLNIGDSLSAARYLQQAKILNDNNSDEKIKATYWHMMGLSKYLYGIRSESLQYFIHSAELSKAIDEGLYLTNIQIIANCAGEYGDYETAKKYTEELILQDKKQKRYLDVAISYIYMSGITMDAGEILITNSQIL